MKKILAAAALAAVPLMAAGVPAHAAPSYQPNRAGNGVTQMTLECDNGQTVDVLVAGNHSSDMGGWAAARVVGDGVLLPTSFTFALVDLNDPATPLWQGVQAKGGGKAQSRQQTITCSVLMPADATIGEVLSTAPGPITVPEDQLGDPAGFLLTVTAVPRP
ncbi:hypothetical protein GA0111570_104144 [Raineyella antarctica]|uniref:Uncharacterized protein n=1 Tax=Raineyella antarctica TaxID=1577474 RepID=A0A1G6GNY8_9ACTN|nr:hypothetical protein [Raineyella antarctica]SDB83465.1 hypothetical protein GA0111570_104144 [Raineyella antarctica]